MNNNSVKLTKTLTQILILGLIVLDIFGYWAVEHVAVELMKEDMGLYGGLSLLICMYITSVPTFYLLINVYKLIKNIEINKIFDSENIDFLNKASISCFIISLISLAFMYFWTSLVIIIVSAIFLGLIIRVVRDIFKRAIMMKDELDLTI